MGPSPSAGYWSATVVSDPFPIVRCSGLSMHLRRTLIGLSALAGLAAPGAAQAAALAPLAPCYRSVDEFARENVAIRASGFTPGSNVDVYIDGVVVQSGVQPLPDGTVS